MLTIPLRLRSVAATLVLGLTLATGAVGLPAALDQTPTASAQNFANTIDPNARGSITVHKRLGAQATTHDTGNVNPNPGGDPRPGVTFRLEKLRANLATNEGFQQAQSLNVNSPRDPNFAGIDRVTDANGEISFSNLPVGVYVLHEIGQPDSVVPSQPFLVFVPMTNPATQTGWNYDVHVYPKNFTNAATKVVADADKNVGDSITYTITSDVPAPASPTGNITKYELVDNYDWANLEAPTMTVALSDGTQFAPSDFTLVATPGQPIRGVMLASGLEKLTAAKRQTPNLAVITTITATVKAVDGTDGTANNSAKIISNSGTGEDTTSTTETVETQWGKLEIQKLGKNNSPLSGAKFNLYQCTDPTGGGVIVPLGAKLTVGGTDTWTTSSGVALIDGLHVTDFENNVAVSPVTKKFCLVEIEAPAGYELLPRPIPISFTRNEIADTADGTDALTLRATITNVASTQPNLPLTGGKGIVLIVIVGAGIVAAGVWYARRASMKS